MRKEFLQRRIARLQKKIADLRARGLASQDANEVRSINEAIEEYTEELRDAQDELAVIEAEEAAPAADPAEPVRSGEPVPEGATRVGGTVAGSFNVGTRSEVPVRETMEYREAFRAYVVSGTPMPAEIRGEAIDTGDTGAVIPMTVMNEVVNTVRKRYGNLYAKVRKISVRGGVEIPIVALSAKFKWIGEKTVSPRQDIGPVGKVTFSYHTAEIRIAQTFLSQLLSLSAFEAEISKVIATAYVEAMDYGIVNGSGDGCMLGILNDPRITNTVTMSAADFSNWKAWRQKFFSKLPLGYRAGEFIFPVATVDAYLETMSDANGNPIFRQATGLEVNEGEANGRFFGRDISLVEPDIIADFDSASASDVIGVFWQPEEYAINENFGFTMRRYFDEETNEWVDKALVVVDGKVLNPNGFYKILKG